MQQLVSCSVRRWQAFVFDLSTCKRSALPSIKTYARLAALILSPPCCAVQPLEAEVRTLRCQNWRGEAKKDLSPFSVDKRILAFCQLMY